MIETVREDGALRGRYQNTTAIIYSSALPTILLETSLADSRAYPLGSNTGGILFWVAK
jgi:hypothetical protein